MSEPNNMEETFIFNTFFIFVVFTFISMIFNTIILFYLILFNTKITMFNSSLLSFPFLINIHFKVVPCDLIRLIVLKKL